MSAFISVIIPNYNGGKTIGDCLEAVLASDYGEFEVIVVDDCSSDDSIEVIKRFPCKLVRLDRHSGAAKARNAGAWQSRGEILFFTDADCLLQHDTLTVASETAALEGPDVIVGGTYTLLPHDKRFFSRFQSVFINYSETKQAANPDYLATHALAIHARTFRDNHGFAEDFLPILEDVEFSHRLRRAGYRLVLSPAIQVRHIFNYSLYRSLRNAIRKARYWTLYSLRNRDLLRDSGTASTELKLNVAAYLAVALLLFTYFASGNSVLLVPAAMVLATNAWVSRGLLKAFFRTGGLGFASAAALYYLLLYPLAVGLGAGIGAVKALGAGYGRRKAE